MATKIETYTFLVSGVFSDNAPRKSRAVDTDYPIIQMDVIESYTINMSNRVSNYAIESRSNISDHIFSENTKLQFTAKIGYAFPLYYVAGNSLIDYSQENSIKANKPQQAYELIKKLRDDKLAFDVLTEQELFEGMVITDLSVAREAGDDQLVFNISLEKFRKVNIGKTVLASVNTGTDKGKELSKKTANKTSEGGKTSGDTNKKMVATRGYLNKEKDKAEVAKAQSSGKTVQYVEDRNITENQ
ncbi:MAG: hypothetical protein EOM41_01195 [Bacilli bacterium]|nr:hypothetical protein [Bacilli bacterium]